MIFNLSYLTEKELEVLVEKATKKRARIIDEENTDRRNMYLFIALIVFVVFFLCVIHLVEPIDRDKAFASTVFGMLFFVVTAIYLSKKVGEAEEKLFPLEEAITLYIAQKYYDIDNTSLFLSKLYKSNEVERNLRRHISSFLYTQKKKFQDYLDTLDNKELELLATPYKESLISQIDSIVQAYLDKKWGERQADINFRNISKEFFYSSLPKNLARTNSIK